MSETPSSWGAAESAWLGRLQQGEERGRHRAALPWHCPLQGRSSTLHPAGRRPRWPGRGPSGQQYWSHQPLGGYLLVQSGEVPGGCSGTSATHCISPGPTSRAGVRRIRMLPLLTGRRRAAWRLGGWREGERSGLVRSPPSTWQEKRHPVEASCFLEATCHATWARPQQLGSLSAREVNSGGRNLEDGRTSPGALHFLGIWRHLVVNVRSPEVSSTWYPGLFILLILGALLALNSHFLSSP